MVSLSVVSRGNLTNHFLSHVQHAEAFCEHGVSGGTCGYGICYNAVMCICDEGYVHDPAFQYYANCFTPWYIYPMTHLIVGVLCVAVSIYGLFVYRKVLPGPAKRLVVGANSFALVYAIIMLAHELEGRMGVVTEVFHWLSILVVFLLILPPSMDLYIFPAFEFSHSRSYARIKRGMLCLFIAWTIVFTVISIDAQMKLSVEHDLKGFNRMRAFAHVCLATLCLLVLLAFHLAARKVILLLETILQSGRVRGGRNTNRENQGENDPAVSEQAKQHVERVKNTQSIVFPAIMSAMASDAILSSLHFYFEVFPYQYIFFIGLAWPVPIFCFVLLRLVSKQSFGSHHQTNEVPPAIPRDFLHAAAASSMDGQRNPVPQAQETPLPEEAATLRGGLFRRGSRRRMNPTLPAASSHSSANREADSGASGLSLGVI